MKKIILLLLISLAGSVANAQYKTFDFGGIQYNANCFYNKKGFITIDIQDRKSTRQNSSHGVQSRMPSSA